jgi:amino acid transporter
MMLPVSDKPLSIFKLVMMAVVAIDSLKNLPSNAQYGSSLIVYYLIAVAVFFIPSALITAELATSIPLAGGAYRWVCLAFGKGNAFIAAWMQWLIMLVWSPTILSFIASTVLYLIAPSLADNHFIMFGSVILFFWLGLLLVSRGIHISSRVGTISAIVGVILPMFFMIVLSIAWVLQGHRANITFTMTSINHDFFSSEHFRLFIPILYSLMGMEMIAVYVNDVENPKRDYPIVLLIASLLIFLSVVLASLAIAVVTPQKEISLTTGIIESCDHFLRAFHLTNWLFLMVIAISVGGFGIFYSWLLTVSKYLLSAAEDGSLPDFMKSKNKNGMPNKQMILQGCIATLLSAAFIFMPSVNYAFWLLSVSCAQFGLIYYVYLFSAAIYLRFKEPDMLRPFKIGKGNGLLISLCAIAIITSIVSIGFGFIPPDGMEKKYIFSYELSLILMMVGGLGIGLIIYYYNQFTTQSASYDMAYAQHST